jgi:hypothetical protein
MDSDRFRSYKLGDGQIKTAAGQIGVGPGYSGGFRLSPAGLGRLAAGPSSYRRTTRNSRAADCEQQRGG